MLSCCPCGGTMASGFVTKARRSITRAAHKAVAASAIETFLDELPAIPALDKLASVSIKVDDVEQIQSAVQRYVFGKHCDFQPIQFWIRDDTKEKTPILSAEIFYNRGFVVKDLREKDQEYLVVTLPQQSPSILGKLQHPAGTTVYKIIQTPVSEKLMVQKCTKSPDKPLQIWKFPKVGMQTAHSLNMLFDYHVYKLQKEGKNVVKVRPKAKSADNTYIVEFLTKDQQERALGLGIGLLLTLTVAYEEIHKVLKENILEDKNQG